MSLVALDFPPGIVRDETGYRAEGRWWDGNKMRFRNGRPEMIGGWRKKTTSGSITFGETTIHLYYQPVNRQVTQLVPATGSPGSVWAGTTNNFYRIPFTDDSSGASAIAITFRQPAAVALGNNPINDYTAANLLKITEANHKKRFLDQVTLAGATTFAGIAVGNLNRTFTVVGIQDANTYIIEATTPSFTYPGSATSGGGAGVTVQWSFNSALASGYASTFPRRWSQVAYGVDTVFCDWGSAIYYMNTYTRGASLLCEWSSTYPSAVDENLGLIANSVPRMAFGVELGRDRSLIAFGANPFDSIYQDPLLVRWSDQENISDWEPREDNTAGDFKIPWGSQIRAWIQTKREILIWTDTSLVSMKWVGAPYYYSFDKVADNVPIADLRCAQAVGDTVYWMGSGTFYKYDGSVSVIPCPVVRYFFSLSSVSSPLAAGFNSVTGTSSLFSGQVPSYSEVWFFSATGYYAAYNYAENVWSIGDFQNAGRTAWAVTSQNRPVAVGGYDLYRHEVSYADDDGTTASNITAYIESGDFDLAEGDKFQFASRMIADHGYTGNTSGTVTYAFLGREDPLETPTTLYTCTVTPTEGRKDIRFRARQVALKVSSTANDFKWYLGKPRLDVQPDGMR